MSKNNETESPVINLVGNGTTIKGDIRANGDMRIDGTLTGSLHAKGKIVIGTTGLVEGEIVCQSGDFSGTIKANISVSDLLMIKSTANLTGDLKVGKLAVEPGAKFTGTCSMQDTATPSLHTSASNEQKNKKTTL